MAGTLAHQALVRIGKVFKVEVEISGQPPNERALRRVAIGRKNYLHHGSGAGGIRAAVIYTLIGSAQRN